MPKKPVREMNLIERMHYSLSAKTFHAILLLSAIISLTAIILSFTLYSDSVTREYRVRTWHMSKSSAILPEISEVRSAAEKVLDVYDSLSETEKADNSADYLSRFAFVEDEDFGALRSMIYQLQEENGAIAAYTAALDAERSRMIFIADGDPKASYCPPGMWDELKPKDISGLINGTHGSQLDIFYGADPIPAIVTRMKQYGYRCTAGTKLFDVNDYPVMIFFDTDMNETVRAGWTFLGQFVLILAVVTVITAMFMVNHMKKTLVRPVNKLAEAAESYIRAKQSGEAVGGYFDRLNIRTGDEIENLSLSLQTMEKEVSAYENDLTRVTAEKEHIQTELNLAGNIQKGIIPNIFPAYPDRAEFDLFASMDPAKEVGGDFYDFFLIDPDHLCMVMADVSGKGVPASLFMMVSKILIKNRVQNGDSPAQALENVNRQLMEGNKMDMFVTVWLAILEISTGKGIAANAGHEHPALRRKDGSFELEVYCHSPAVGMMEGIRYREHEFELHPGDSLFVYTDGVPEASNSSNELFGPDRMLAALNRDPDADPVTILRNVAESINTFVAGAEQFDDTTMLCLKYKGQTGK